MKKAICTLAVLLLIAASFAQAPQKFNYQAVARNSAGDVIQNLPVSFRIGIRDLSPTGTLLYRETHNVTTNNFGLVTLPVGAGTPVSGNFTAINWGSGAKYIEIELDPAGGINYSPVGISQLLSVPYALYAQQSASGIPGPTGPTGPTGTGGSGSISCATLFNDDYTVRGAGTGNWACTDAMQISSSGYVSINTTPSSSYRLRLNGNEGIGSSPNSSYTLSVDGTGHFTDYVGIGTTPNSSYDLRVYANAGIGFSPNSSYELSVDGDGHFTDYVGIGTTPSSSYRLYVNGNARITDGLGVSSSSVPSSGLYVGSSSNFYVPTSIGSSSGTTLVLSSGEVYKLSSSLRYKENVDDLSFDKNVFFQLRPVNFSYKKSCGGSGEAEVGFVAEEVDKIMPQLVVYEYQPKIGSDGKPLLNEFGYTERENTGNPDGIKYEQVCVYLYQIVKEQEKRIAELELAMKKIQGPYPGK